MCVHVCVSYDQREVLSREEEILRKAVERDDGTMRHESKGGLFVRKGIGQSRLAYGHLGEGKKLGQSIKPHMCEMHTEPHH